MLKVFGMFFSGKFKVNIINSKKGEITYIYNKFLKKIPTCVCADTVSF
jgi:hypothetical protein